MTLTLSLVLNALLIGVVGLALYIILKQEKAIQLYKQLYDLTKE
jgi:hypothetical protein